MANTLQKTDQATDVIKELYYKYIWHIHSQKENPGIYCIICLPFSELCHLFI